jgi:predicted phage-related endonuclease
MDKDVVDIAALGSGSDFRIYHYYRNKELEQQIIDATHDFWHNNVLKQIPPEPIDNTDLIKLYQKGDESKILVADEKTSEYAYEQRRIKNQIAELKKQHDFIEMEIKAAMKDHAFLVDVNGTELATWKNQVANKFQQKKFKASNCEIYNEFCEPVESRVLRNKIK